VPAVVTLKERLGWEKDVRRGNAICTAITIQGIEPDIQTEISASIEGEGLCTSVRPIQI
jgi:hypothetical protein